MDFNRRTFIKVCAGTVLGLGAAFLSGCDEEIEYGVPHEIIIPGPLGYAIDSGSIFRSKRSYTSWLKDFDVIPSFDYEKLRFGAGKRQIDLEWHHTDETKRELVPRNGAQLASLGIVDFNSITIDKLMSEQYSTQAIDGSDNSELLLPKTCFAIRTRKGNFAKMMVNGYLPLTHRQRSDEDVAKYNLQCTLVAYKKPQSK